jgi:hypothetical protein
MEAGKRGGRCLQTIRRHCHNKVSVRRWQARFEFVIGDCAHPFAMKDDVPSTTESGAITRKNAMNKITTTLIALVCLLLTPGAIMARDSSASGKSSSTQHSDSANHFSSANRAATKSTTLVSSSHRSISIDGVQRDAKGRVQRSSTLREKFMRPGRAHAWPCHVVGDSVPPKRGDSDSLSGKRLQRAKPRTR